MPDKYHNDKAEEYRIRAKGIMLDVLGVERILADGADWRKFMTGYSGFSLPKRAYIGAKKEFAPVRADMEDEQTVRIGYETTILEQYYKGVSMMAGIADEYLEAEDGAV